jgi:ankyrin repeat protein
LTFKTPLLLAVQNQYYEIAKLLLEKKAKVDGRGHAFYSPLISAVSERSTRLVQPFCDHGADLNQSDEIQRD